MAAKMYVRMSNISLRFRFERKLLLPYCLICFELNYKTGAAVCDVHRPYPRANGPPRHCAQARGREGRFELNPSQSCALRTQLLGEVQFFVHTSIWEIIFASMLSDLLWIGLQNGVGAVSSWIHFNHAHWTLFVNGEVQYFVQTMIWA